MVFSFTVLCTWYHGRWCFDDGINERTVLVSKVSNNIMSETTVWPQGRAVQRYIFFLKKQGTHLQPLFPPLGFVTGFERVPILGIEKIKMTVRVLQLQDLSYDDYHPETHTCFSVLELPFYSTKEIMHTKLTEALSKNKRIYKWWWDCTLTLHCICTEQSTLEMAGQRAAFVSTAACVLANMNCFKCDVWCVKMCVVGGYKKWMSHRENTGINVHMLQGSLKKVI